MHSGQLHNWGLLQLDAIHSGHCHSSSGIDLIQESPPTCQNIAPTLFVVFVTARNLHCIVSVHVVKNVITSSMINAHCTVQTSALVSATFVFAKCTDFWPCPILGRLFARIWHCYTVAYPRAFARPSDTQRGLVPGCRWLLSRHLGTVTIGRPFLCWHVCSHPFCLRIPHTIQKRTLQIYFATYIAGYLRYLTRLCSKTWIKRRCVLCSIHFIWIQLHFISHLALLKRSIMKSVLQTQHVEH